MTFPTYPKNSERGQALIVIAIVLVVLAGIIGLAIDGGNVFLDRRKAQNAADAAALAAALARVRGGQNPTVVALAAVAAVADVDVLDRVSGDPAVTRDLCNIMREDETEPSLPREDVLRNAPAQEDGFIKAPRVM